MEGDDTNKRSSNAQDWSLKIIEKAKKQSSFRGSEA